MKRKSHPLRFVVLVLCVLFLLTLFAGKTFYDAGELGAVFDHPLPGCILHKNITGAEDLTTVDDGRTVLISAVDRHDISEVKVIPGIYIYTEGSSPRLLAAIDGKPHGISAYPSELGYHVHVVVHKPGEDDRVEIYEWKTAEQTFTQVKTIRFAGIQQLNGIVAMADDSFFVSQDFGYPAGPLQEIEKAFRLPLGKIWYYDGTSDKPKIAREDILYPNGLAVSPDKKHLYLASLTGRSLIDYDLNIDDKGEVTLKWRREWPLYTAPDNLKWAGDTLLIGSHRKLISLLLHSFDSKRYHAASQLIQVSGLPDRLIVKELHSTRSGGVEAVSTGVLSTVNNRIVMGGIWSEGVLDCEGTDTFPLSQPASPSTGNEPVPQSTP
ncbi:MAG: hypothetical protein EOP10_06910 [Proteobacteria bacterium]|nr:MAG: hypothetical protein EOP10_06910 [Pseudomonadota bacterium]